MKRTKRRAVIGIDQGTANFGIVVNYMLDGGEIRASKLGVTQWPGNSFRGALEVFNTFIRLYRGIDADVVLIALEGRAYGMATRAADGGKMAGYNMAGLWHVDTMIQYFCAAERIPFIVLSPGSWKRFVGGKGKGRMTKPEVQAVMKQQGLYAKDNNIQDAIALSLLGTAKYLLDAGDDRTLQKLFPDEEQRLYLRRQFRTNIERDFMMEWPEVQA